MTVQSQFLIEESAPEEPHDYRCKKCNGLVDPGDQIDGSLTVSMLAVAHWVVTWQQEQFASTKYVPHWRKALAEVIRQRVLTAGNNNIIKSIRSGLIRPDDHWLGLFEQAIELVAEEEGLSLEPSTRPP